MTLERALADKLVEIRVRHTQGSYKKAVLLLTPLVRHRPWIRIRPVWRIDNPEDSRSSDMVLIAELHVRLPAKNNRQVYLPQVQLRPTSNRSGRKGAELVLLDPDDDEDLLTLLAEPNARAATAAAHAAAAPNAHAADLDDHRRLLS